jgi:hypothetical protein
MHGVLAMAAAHKAYLCPSSRRTYLPLADYHQTLGSEGYRRCLQNFQISNWMPVFGFATIVVFHMLTLPLRMNNRILEEPIKNFIELAGLLRGIKTTLEPALRRIVKTEFAPVVYGIWTIDSDEADRCVQSAALCTNTELTQKIAVPLLTIQLYPQIPGLRTKGFEHFKKPIFLPVALNIMQQPWKASNPLPGFLLPLDSTQRWEQHSSGYTLFTIACFLTLLHTGPMPFFFWLIILYTGQP